MLDPLEKNLSRLVLIRQFIIASTKDEVIIEVFRKKGAA